MIAYLQGRVINLLNENKVILKTPYGTGYLVHTNPLQKYMINENLELYILYIQRDDKVDLYGFGSIDEREWVEKLLKVSGIGPKMAANIVYTLGTENLNQIIDQKDVDALTSVKGLGKKTAQKIVIDLKGVAVDMDKILEDTRTSGTSTEFTINFTEALSGLGYKKGEIVNTISRLKKENLWNQDNLVETIRSGLVVLGK